MNIYVGSLPPSTSAKALQGYFKKLVKVVNLRRIKNKGRKSPGYAILKVDTKAEFDYLISTDHFINGQKLIVKAYLTPQQRLKIEKSLVNRRVYVKNLPEYAPVEQLKQLFRRFGDVKSVVLKEKQAQGEVYGFITFFDHHSAKRCLERGFIEFRGNDLEIKQYRINDSKFQKEIPNMVEKSSDGSPINQREVFEKRHPGEVEENLSSNRLKTRFIDSQQDHEVNNEKILEPKINPEEVEHSLGKIGITAEIQGVNFKGYPKPSFREIEGNYWVTERLMLKGISKKDSRLSRKHDSYNLNFNKAGYRSRIEVRQAQLEGEGGFF